MIFQSSPTIHDETRNKIDSSPSQKSPRSLSRNKFQLVCVIVIYTIGIHSFPPSTTIPSNFKILYRFNLEIRFVSPSDSAKRSVSLIVALNKQPAGETHRKFLVVDAVPSSRVCTSCRICPPPQTESSTVSRRELIKVRRAYGAKYFVVAARSKTNESRRGNNHPGGGSILLFLILGCPVFTSVSGRPCCRNIKRWTVVAEIKNDRISRGTRIANAQGTSILVIRTTASQWPQGDYKLKQLIISGLVV